MSKLQAGLIAFIALVVGVVAALYIKPPSNNVKMQHVSLYPQVRALPDFQLVDHNDKAFTPQNLMGHWSLIFVGYTYCPDICPTTLAELKGIYPELQKIPSEFPIQIVLLSVDPKRDTPKRLNEYINFFHPDFIAVSGEHPQLFPLVRAMGMMYSMSESTDNPNYLVDHSSSVVVLNPRAQVVGRFKPDFVVGQLPISEGQKILVDMPAIMSQ
ncbi:MAG: protein SCO1/2 [Paraglaciecola sp.]|jgi:protein SCO1/2|uniref:SCO family protein n=1 Tax=uncultured Paraglaciecola sp. TaxID=1765024 RepID=UPI0025F2636B|nr:SCO family protein [uncultured Paraglaciecola sp.]